MSTALKPRLLRRNGQWCCVDRSACGAGDTAFLAWMSWLKLSLSRYDFERTA